MDDTAAALGLTTRRLSVEQKKLPKRVSFKDDASVINIPARVESAFDWRNSVVLTKNVVTGDSWKHRADSTNKSTSLDTFPSQRSSSLHANGSQLNQQTPSSSREDENPPPYKSILKTSAPAAQGGNNLNCLNRTYMPARRTRDLSARHSLDYYNFKQGSSNSSFTRYTKNTLEKPALARPVTGRHSLICRRLSTEDGSLCRDKNQRFLRRELSPETTWSDNDFHRSERTGVSKSARPPQANFDVVGVTHGRVDKLPYFYDISGVMNSTGRYNHLANSSSTVDRVRLAHSSVSTTNQFDSRKPEARNFSAIPAISAFSRKNRRKHLPNNCESEYDSSPKRQLPMAWQPAKQYNFSTK